MVVERPKQRIHEDEYGRSVPLMTDVRRHVTFRQCDVAGDLAALFVDVYDPELAVCHYAPFWRRTAFM